MASKTYTCSQIKQSWYICTKPAKLLNEAYGKSRRYAVTSFNQGIGSVTRGEGTYDVALPVSKCSCGTYQETGIPCQHIVALCMAQKLDPEQYTAPCYHATVYIQQYEQRMVPISCEELAISSECLVPCYQRAAGRPRKARRRIGQSASSNYTSKRCGEKGHNSRNKSCRGARFGCLHASLDVLQANRYAPQL